MQRVATTTLAPQLHRQTLTPNTNTQPHALYLFSVWHQRKHICPYPPIRPYLRKTRLEVHGMPAAAEHGLAHRVRRVPDQDVGQRGPGASHQRPD